MKKVFISLICLISLISPSVIQNALAEQKIYTIVIDAGHGGKDPGAISRGRREKVVALQLAKRLKRHLEALLPCKVLMTRTSDRFISLGERDRISKKAKADLFISLHTNAARRRAANGIEIYYLNNATDQASKRLAARENAEAPRPIHDSDAILGGMLQNLFTEESLILARHVRNALKGSLKKYKMERLKIKSALFYVLVAPGAPGLLIETGFITHPREGKNLTNGDYQERMAEGIARGIRKYLMDGESQNRNL